MKTANITEDTLISDPVGKGSHSGAIPCLLRIVATSWPAGQVSLYQEGSTLLQTQGAGDQVEVPLTSEDLTVTCANWSGVSGLFLHIEIIRS